jgi:hypothetical protein
MAPHCDKPRLTSPVESRREFSGTGAP